MAGLCRSYQHLGKGSGQVSDDKSDGFIAKSHMEAVAGLQNQPLPFATSKKSHKGI
jgi:hypothetical protein